MLEAVIFDIDGTLIDSVDTHAAAWQRTLKKYGKDVPFERARAQIGKGADQLMPEFLSQAEIEEFGEELTAARDALFRKEYRALITPFTGVRALFERLHADNIKLALGSSSNEEDLQYYKKLLDIADLLTEETSADDAAQSKPQPDIFAAALKKLGSPQTDRVVMIGDTPYDAEAARKAGIKNCVGFLCGGFAEKDLRAAGCVEIYQSPSHLLAQYHQSLLKEVDSR